ncbi:MAG TPA: hypothetical protein PLX89_14315, partial [Verrucomicrobiota bacterium]|nr:hypothetical protein [Verrucomicrobiota bacterium]
EEAILKVSPRLEKLNWRIESNADGGQPSTLFPDRGSTVQFVASDRHDRAKIYFELKTKSGNYKGSIPVEVFAPTGVEFSHLGAAGFKRVSGGTETEHILRGVFSPTDVSWAYIEWYEDDSPIIRTEDFVGLDGYAHCSGSGGCNWTPLRAVPAGNCASCGPLDKGSIPNFAPWIQPSSRGLWGFQFQILYRVLGSPSNAAKIADVYDFWVFDGSGSFYHSKSTTAGLPRTSPIFYFTDESSSRTDPSRGECCLFDE